MKYVEIIAPAHWASYLINNDASGLTEDEATECFEFFDDLGFKMTDCISCQPVGIMRFNGLLTDCEEYVFVLQS